MNKINRRFIGKKISLIVFNIFKSACKYITRLNQPSEYSLVGDDLLY